LIKEQTGSLEQLKHWECNGNRKYNCES